MSTPSFKKHLLTIIIYTEVTVGPSCYSWLPHMCTYSQLKHQDHLAETVKILCTSLLKCLHFHPISSKKYHVTLSKLSHVISTPLTGRSKLPFYFTFFALSSFILVLTQTIYTIICQPWNATSSLHWARVLCCMSFIYCCHLIKAKRKLFLFCIG